MQRVSPESAVTARIVVQCGLLWSRCGRRLAWIGALVAMQGCDGSSPSSEGGSAGGSSAAGTSTVSGGATASGGSSTAGQPSMPASGGAGAGAAPSGGAGGSGGTAGMGGASAGGGFSATGGTAAVGGYGATGGSGAIGGVGATGGIGGAGGSAAATSASGAAGSAGAGGTPIPQAGAGGGAGAGAGLEIDFDAYWDFEAEVAGSVPDTLGSDFALQLQGAALAAGPTGQYLRITGANSSAATASAPLDTSASFSVSAWIRLDALGNFTTLVAQDGDAVSAFYLQKRSDERLSFTTFPEDSTAATSCVTTGEIKPRLGEWYHVVGTRDAASREQRLYVDGLLSGRVTCPGGVFRAPGALSVGRGWYAGAATDFVDGGVDDLGIIGRVLEPEEVFELYRVGRPDAHHYLFAYFVEVAQGRGDGLRLAHSHDGLHWGAIGAGKVFMPPSVGGGSFRDPHVMQDPGGMYHLVWTTTCVPWAEANCVQDRGLGHASSPNLVDWGDPDYIEIGLNVEHVWAPETAYDEATSQYLVFWSSPLDQNPSASDPHSIYYLLTPDFQSFTAPEVLYSQPGRNFIDATIRRQGDGYLMIIKDEADGQKNLRALRSPTLFGAGAWTSSPSAPLTGNYAAEGPSLLQRDGELFTYFDKYGEGAYGALRATADTNLDQPASWQDISDSVFFPGVRHGTPIEVPWGVLRAVALEAGR